MKTEDIVEKIKNGGGVRADLSGVDLSGVNLSGVDLTGAILSYANLSGAVLYEVNLYGANLYGANLSNANLSKAYLRCTDLIKATLDGVKGIKYLGGFDYRGYVLVSWKFQGEIRFNVGCRYFRTAEDAIAHWSSADYPNEELGARYVKSVKSLMKMWEEENEVIDVTFLLSVKSGQQLKN